MTRHEVVWAGQHDWFHSSEVVSLGEWQVWVKEGDKVHPWPFRDWVELRAWAGY